MRALCGKAFDQLVVGTSVIVIRARLGEHAPTGGRAATRILYPQLGVAKTLHLLIDLLGLDLYSRCCVHPRGTARINQAVAS